MTPAKRSQLQLRTPGGQRLPTEAEMKAAMERVRAGRNPERRDLVPTAEPDPTVPDWLIVFSLEVEQATKRAIRAYLDWRERGDKPPAGRHRPHV